MRLSRVLVPAAALMLAGCASIQQLTGRGDPAERLAAGVTITRDAWGVPHITGRTAAHVAFGAGWAQAEDGFEALEEVLLHALGRAAHWHGDRYLAADMVKAAFEVERLAREEYGREPADRRAVWDAFADGINYYIRVSGVRPRLVTRIEPWMPFAVVRTIDDATIVDGVRLGAIAPRPAVLADADAAPAVAQPWSAAAVAPSRTADGHALLTGILRGEFFGASREYEMVLNSEDGWRVRGFAMLGTPVPRVGYSERIAWSHASSTADAADAYRVTLVRRDGAVRYRFDDDWRDAVQWTDTLLVNTPAGVRARAFTFTRTHHGPVVADSLAIRIGRLAEGGLLQQWYAMGRARDLGEFRAALDARAANAATVYADVDGNIFRVDAGAVPVRDPSFDWTAPVDGHASKTEWRGYHSLDELPQVLNPAGGRIDGPSVDAGAAGHPAYMTVRAVHDGSPSFSESVRTFDAARATVFDARMRGVEAAVMRLASEWEQVGGTNPVRARRLDDAVELLRSWDGAVHADSRETTLYVLWQERRRSAPAPLEYAAFRALEDVVIALGDTVPAWGEVNRLQRTGPGRFSDDAPSVPVSGVPEATGATFTIDAERPEGQRLRYGVRGVTAAMVVELAASGRAGTVVTFGQSADPASAHFFDQAALLARQELKAAWFEHASTASGAQRTYRPGAMLRAR